MSEAKQSKAISTDSQVEQITPARAAEMLVRNVGNRPLRHSLVRRYAGDMSSGRWMFNGEPIIISSSGRVLDGQHRLQAVVKSQVSIMALVVYGVDDSAFSTIDTGKMRQGSDIVGILGAKQNRIVAAAIHLIVAYEKGSIGSFGWPRINNQAIAAEYPKRPGLEASAKLARPAHRVVGSAGIPAAMHWMFFRANDSMADAFISALVSGAGLITGDPVLALRERLIAERSKKTRMKQGEVVALFIKAWNAYIAGKVVNGSTLRWQEREPFPKISGYADFNTSEV